MPPELDLPMQKDPLFVLKPIGNYEPVVEEIQRIFHCDPEAPIKKLIVFIQSTLLSNVLLKIMAWESSWSKRNINDLKRIDRERIKKCVSRSHYDWLWRSLCVL